MTLPDASDISTFHIGVFKLICAAASAVGTLGFISIDSDRGVRHAV